MGNAKYKQKHKEQGLCVDCSRPALPFRVHCIIHNENRRQYMENEFKKDPVRQHKLNRKTKQRYRETNRCTACSAPLGEQDEGKTHCMNCRDRAFQAIPRHSPVGGALLEDYYKEAAKQS